MTRRSTRRKRVPDTVVHEANLDELAILKLKWFVRRTWPVVEPGDDLIWNWHIDLLCDELEAVTRYEVRELLICIPPGCMKSLLVSVFMPAWWWLRRPENRYVTFAHTAGLATRDSRKMRDILSSDIYGNLRTRAATHHGGHDWEFAHDQNEKVNFENSRKGFRQCFGLEGSITGSRGHGMIIDDPHDVSDAIGSPEQVMRRMDGTAHIVGKVLPSRVNKPKQAWKVAIQQRIHEADTAGRMLEDGVDRKVILQMEFDPDFEHNHPRDPRTEHGELLFPEHIPREFIENLKKPSQLGVEQYSAQYQQLPVPASGGLFKKAWFTKFYDSDPQLFAVQMDEVMISADLTFKGTKTADYVSIQVWGRKGAKFYLLWHVHKRMNYVDTRREFIFVCRMFPSARTKLVEEAANGAALLADLQASITGLIPVNPGASKYERAQIGSVPVFEAGNVYLPEPSLVPWSVDAYIAEHISFPMGANDDQVDASSQYFLRVTGAANVDVLDRMASQFSFMD